MKNIEIVRIAVQALYDKKAKDIEIIKIEGLSVLADYMVLASGTSTTQVKALADETEAKISEAGTKPDHIEGRSSSWILLDYESVIVHVFHVKERDFYALGHLWADGERIDISTLIDTSKGE